MAFVSSRERRGAASARLAQAHRVFTQDGSPAQPQRPVKSMRLALYLWASLRLCLSSRKEQAERWPAPPGLRGLQLLSCLYLVPRFWVSLGLQVSRQPLLSGSSRKSFLVQSEEAGEKSRMLSQPAQPAPGVCSPFQVLPTHLAPPPPSRRCVAGLGPASVCSAA